MNYLYHAVPQSMQGTVLYPLNQLKNIFPDIYVEQFAKYVNRPHIPQQRIPILDCLWNDMLHFSAVHPHQTKDALILAGAGYSRPISFFQIDPLILELENTIVFQQTTKDQSENDFQNSFTKFDIAYMNKYAELPSITQRYFQKMIALNKPILTNSYIPHILYLGTINTCNIEIITV